MNFLLGVLVLAATTVGARRLATRCSTDRLSAILIGATAFFALFLAAFYLQGFAELLLHKPVISLPLTALLLLLLVAATFLLPRKSATVTTTGWPDGRGPLRRVPRFLVVVTTGAFGLLAALLLLSLPRGYEVRAYHLPIAVRILRDGTLGLWDSAFMHAYPANMSIWAGFLLHFLPEHVASIANLPFATLLAAATYGLCRSVGSDRSAAVVMTAGLLTVPIFGFSILEVGADVAGVAFACVCAYMILARPLPARANALVAGLAAGLAFGFKSLNFVPIVCLSLVVFVQGVLVWRCADRPGKTFAAFVPTCWFVTGALAMTGFWLCRNLLEAGNPLYPVHVKGLFDLFGWKAATDFDLASRAVNEHEWVATSRGWFVYPWLEGHFLKQNFKHSSGLGPFFAATVPIVLILWPLLLIGAWRARASGALDRQLAAQAMLYVVALVVFCAWWFLGDRQPRYFMVAIAMLVPLAAVLLTANTGRLRTAHELMLSFCVLVMVFVTVIRLGLENGPFLGKEWGASRWQALEYPSLIDRLPPGSVIVNAIDRPVSYTLLGDGLANHVVDSAKAVELFGAPGGTIRLAKDQLAALGATHLYAVASTRITTDDCIRLRELQRLDRNPFNGQPYQDPRVLYAIDFDCAQSGY